MPDRSEFLFHFVELERLDDRFNFFHGIPRKYFWGMAARLERG